MNIGDKTIGPGEPVLVIAEIGVNHDGSVERALDLVQIAADCGADAVKLQIFRAQTLLHASCRLAAYQEGCATDPAEMLRRYELSEDGLARIVNQIREIGLVPLATPFSPRDVETAAKLNLPAIKIASPDIVNRLLIEEAAKLERPMLLSTGAATMEEIEQAVGWMSTPFALLHCVSSYPTAAADAHLGWIGELQRRFEAPIGYSDHQTDSISGALAVAAGACILERHLTYDRTACGPDHAASSDPADFARYVAGVRAAETMRGAGAKHVLDCERDVRSVSRQSLVLCRDVPAGREIVRNDLTVQRPGSGISPALVDSIVGRRTASDLSAGTMLQWDNLILRQSA
jgi:sialic acid synthase SpsE